MAMTIQATTAALQPVLAQPETPAQGVQWKLDSFAGRLVEISGDESAASLSLVFRLVYEAQRRRECVFFPPDVVRAGIDLAALPVIWVPDALAAARTADRLARSGAFGLLVVDLGLRPVLPLHAQARLAGLAGKHDTALLFITEKSRERPSLGSLVSVRAHAARTRREGDRFRCEARVLKDKRRGPSWGHAEMCHGPDGLR
jgi:recombination protein RecA